MVAKSPGSRISIEGAGPFMVSRVHVHHRASRLGKSARDRPVERAPAFRYGDQKEEQTFSRGCANLRETDANKCRIAQRQSRRCPPARARVAKAAAVDRTGRKVRSCTESPR